MTEEKNINIHVVLPAVERAVSGSESRPVEEIELLRLGMEELELNVKSTHHEGLKQDIKERKKYSKLVSWVVVIWLVAVLLLVIASGLKWLELPGYVLVALISGASVGFVGALATIVKHLFKRN